MAYFSKGILGGFSGKVGPVVGLRWRGKDILRSLPQRSNKPPTAEQLIVRQKFGLVIKFLYPLRSILGTYFGKPQGDKSRNNMATSYHIKDALVENEGTYELDYSKVLISKGEMQGLQGVNCTAGAGNTLDLTWDDNSGQGMAQPTDSLFVICYNPENAWYEFFVPAAVRSDAMVTLTLPDIFTDLSVEVWATFANETQKFAATSTYLGAFTIT
ncbi:DUF6266 family protein [Zhouia sp. PK063]|uniref:DUF6266 family protein n=1 Tax=Zhouia sp. PK063 TaxID=3373602 RepID=UPI0037B51EC4